MPRNNRNNIRRAESGQTIVIVALFFATISVAIMLSLAEPALKQLSQTANLEASQQSLYLAKASAEDYLYKMTTNRAVSSPNVLTLGSDSGSASLETVSGEDYIVGTGDSSGLIRKLRYHVTIGTGTTFHYGLQSGTGGIDMTNANSSAIIDGNVYANGPVIGKNSSTNTINGTVVSAGPTGLIQNVHANKSVYAHTISGVVSDEDAYYSGNNISGSTISGSACVNIHCHPNTSPDPDFATMPIPDSVIQQWENSITGNINCATSPYQITTDRTLGNVKINCDLEIKGATVTLTGPVWVNGNFEAKTFAKIQVDPSLGSKSVAIIVDGSNDTAGSKVVLGQSGEFAGSGSPSSYVMVVSMNNSSELGGTVTAIDIAQTITGDLLLYAPHGKINLANSIGLKQVTAHSIVMNQSAKVIYELGLMSLLFTSGPGGRYEYDWFRETQ